MKVVIIRHAEVDCSWSKRCSSNRFDSECSAYDNSELINEVPLRSSFDTKREMPLWFWNSSGRLQWFFNSKRQPEGRKQTIERARRFVELICNNNDDCAVVTHGFFMHTLIQEIPKAGFIMSYSSVKYKNGEYVIAEQ